MSTKDEKKSPKHPGSRDAAEKKRHARRNSDRKKPARDVVYTQPPNFSRKRFLLQLGTMVIVVVALLFVMSLFFKVEEVSVSGVSKYTEWDIREASGIQEGDNLLTLSKASICSRIYKRLPYVKTVRIARKLPDTVLIEIEELDVTYAVETEGEKWWLIRSDGVALEAIEPEKAETHTCIYGVTLQNPKTGEKVAAVQPQPTETMPDGTPVPVTVKAEEKLTAALTIMQNLESYGILGEVKRIDVTDIYDLRLWYGKDARILVRLGDHTRIPDKIELMEGAIRVELEPYAKGTLDVSKADGETKAADFIRSE